MKIISENDIELYTIEELQRQGFQYVYGPAISPDGEKQERSNYGEVLLLGRLKTAVFRLNPNIPDDAVIAAINTVQRIASPELLANNEEFYKLLVEKVKVPYQQDGYERSHEITLIDFENPANNEFLVINQYTIIENNQNKRPDVLLFVNGIPLVLIELKNAADENATMKKAFDQLQTYKSTIPSLFTYQGSAALWRGKPLMAKQKLPVLPRNWKP